ncbi:hypothetical protein HYALB_00007953 [Hymenoscyphus albidus]|uniref:Uncharacterized protein n=1 Tax=Hymenoscyphus albidus TaxID=595503 RepID=A0A9N9PU79_9HELO|nr:hypothetical protein HYALB_00007953 [Hymenoscyphus albidus]
MWHIDRSVDPQINRETTRRIFRMKLLPRHVEDMRAETHALGTLPSWKHVLEMQILAHIGTSELLYSLHCRINIGPNPAARVRSDIDARTIADGFLELQEEFFRITDSSVTLGYWC